MQATALNRIQPQFPAVGHMFRIGAVPRSVADQFVRVVDMKFNTELPIFKPELRHFVGGKPPKEHMPRVWANDGSEAVLIHEQLMEQTRQQFEAECLANFQQHPPLFIQSEDHNAFANMTMQEATVQTTRQSFGNRTYWRQLNQGEPPGKNELRQLI